MQKKRQKGRAWEINKVDEEDADYGGIRNTRGNKKLAALC